MPEALALLAVFVVAVAAWIAAWMHTRNPANYNARAELERLRRQAIWLEERLDVARREKWASDMIGPISDELGATLQRLAASRPRASESRVARGS
jgi:hypothetical protein